MCGIAGRLNCDLDHKVSLDLIKKMTSIIFYRGPDDEGFYINGNFGMGHRRLSIIDPTGGHQPLSNEDKSIWVALNGEIYNYVELRQELIRKGHIFKSSSDTEVIVHLYEDEGEDFVHKLRGMFAIALWDENSKRLILVRDRLGKKPMFYYFVPGRHLIFASEIKSILQDGDVDRTINLRAIDIYLSCLYLPAPYTFFKKIEKLPAAHMLIFSKGNIEIKKYWDLHYRYNHDINEEELIERLIEILTESTRIRLRSDVPLGAFLSGGIDSSIIVLFMSQLLEKPVEAATIGFLDKEFNELPYAREVARVCGCNHYEKVVAPEPDMIGILPKLVWHFDEPFADASAIPTYYVCKNIREKVTVALSGDGGDEAFAGYPRHFVDSVEQKLRFLSAYIRPSWISCISNLLPRWLKGRNSFKNLSYPIDEAAARKHCNVYFNMELKNKIYSNVFKKAIESFDVSLIFRGHYNACDSDNPLDRMLYLDMKTYLVDDILVKVDRMSMANSLEVRAPLLDHRLWEFLATIPPRYKLKGRTSKYLLKKILKRQLPSKLVDREKQGFCVPMHSWLTNELKELTEDYLFSVSFRNRGYFNVDYVRKLWNDLISNSKSQYSYPIWALLILELWYQQNMKSTTQ